MSARSDRLTPASRTREVYSDFDASLVLNPVTGDVSRFTNEAAVAQAIKLTMLTAVGEWPYEPDNGTSLSRDLFEPDDDVSMRVLSETISTAIRNQCSAYALLRDLTVSPGRDPTSVEVTVTYSMAAAPGTTTTARVVLRRAR